MRSEIPLEPPRVTLVTVILHSFIYRLYMSSEITLLSKCRITLVTEDSLVIVCDNLARWTLLVSHSLEAYILASCTIKKVAGKLLPK